MIIKNIEIKNYRGLNNLDIKFNEINSYILGDNGVGKSSILDLLNIIFNKGSFNESDFYNLDDKIEIVIQFKLSDLEIGYFEDIFDTNSDNLISIVALQENINGRIDFFHKETGLTIPYSKIKNLPFVYYNSVKAPEEMNFKKSKTAGKFLNAVIEKYIKDYKIKSEDVVDEQKVNEVANSINKLLNKISIIQDLDIAAKLENDAIRLIPQLIGLSNSDNISINNMGSGIRYMSYVFFEILNTIMKEIDNDKEITFINKDGKRVLPVIIALDEPEIHLHPYMQRNLMNNVKKIINNEDNNFLELLKTCFDIDGIIGQLIICTHSPNILSNNYKEYIRIFKENDQIFTKSGIDIAFDTDEEKHLLAHIQDIKECFFSNVVLIYEGISEIGSIPYFAQKLNIDLDYLKIATIDAGGKTSIPLIEKIIKNFGIKVICVMDKDDENDLNPEYIYTNDRDFECDIVNKLILNDAIDELIEVIELYEKNEKNKDFQKTKLENNKEKLGIQISIDKNYTINQAIATENKELIKLILISWLWKTKNMVRGRLLGEQLSRNNIPEVYKISLEKAKELANNNV
ncbi:MAG TPA: AAA family ATPase [Clostridiaceae bacterium]|nr:AAA family ATPase [Clostridiaceae bacterium]